jgi:hypothetical protein
MRNFIAGIFAALVGAAALGAIALIAACNDLIGEPAMPRAQLNKQ